jgi:hypothetical protein
LISGADAVKQEMSRLQGDGAYVAFDILNIFIFLSHHQSYQHHIQPHKTRQKINGEKMRIKSKPNRKVRIVISYSLCLQIIYY